MYVCTYVFMYVCMYICIYVCMYVCTYVCMYICIYVCIQFTLPRVPRVPVSETARVPHDTFDQYSVSLRQFATQACKYEPLNFSIFACLFDNKTSTNFQNVIFILKFIKKLFDFCLGRPTVWGSLHETAHTVCVHLDFNLPLTYRSEQCVPPTV
jgi:hypothetical protein